MSIFLAALAVAIAAIALISSPGSSAGAVLQGDTDCNQTVDAEDALWALREAASLDVQPCTKTAGDVDCDGSIEAGDAIAIIEFSAGLGAGAAAAAAGCTPIGEAIEGTATPGTTKSPAPTTPGLTASPTPTQAPTASPTPGPDCSGPGGGASLPDDPGGSGTPQADSYSLRTVFSANELGDAAGATIEFALMPGHPNIALVATQAGYIYRVTMDQSQPPSLWGDVSDLVTFGGEEGLLSVAFSPTFEDDCRVYMYYTPGAPSETILARFTATPADLIENSREIILRIPEFANNHNGGHIAFDSEGLLYLSLGDGGGGGDPKESGQDINILRGKVLRIDVSGATGYTNPPSNPYVGKDGLDEIFAIGFRNPFRMTIDPVTDDVWLGDVGQGDWEEVDRVEPGKNYGWDCYEGFQEYDDNDQDVPDQPCIGPFTPPRAVYANPDFGQAVTGGVVYRGDDMPELYGWYIYSDFYSARIWAVDTNSAGSEPVQLVDASVNIPSFTLGADGEVYVVSYDDGIYQLAP